MEENSSEVNSSKSPKNYRLRAARGQSWFFEALRYTHLNLMQNDMDFRGPLSAIESGGMRCAPAWAEEEPGGRFDT